MNKNLHRFFLAFVLLMAFLTGLLLIYLSLYGGDSIRTSAAVGSKADDSINAEVISDKKLICLTFDDGPSEQQTSRLLEGLEKYEAHVTFFVIADNASKCTDVMHNMITLGHTVGNHTCSHTDLTSFSSSLLVEAELEKSAQQIYDACGVYPVHVRPPFGNFNTSVKQAVFNLNMDIIYWNGDSRDWSSRDADSVYSYIVDSADGGDIICLHDLYDSTVDGVLRAVKTLSEKGYRFVNIDELQELESEGFIRGRMWFSAHEYYDFET